MDTHGHRHQHQHVHGAQHGAHRAEVMPAASKPGAKYTCPMHPQIVRDAPGSCPICGMALVPIAGTGEADDSELRDLTRRFWIGVILSLPLVVLAMAPMVGIMEPFGLAPSARGWVEFALALAVKHGLSGARGSLSTRPSSSARSCGHRSLTRRST